MHTLRTWTRRRFLIGALALALLFMQGLGMLHAVFHAGLAQTGAVMTLHDGAAGSALHSEAAEDATASAPSAFAKVFAALDDDATADGRLFDAKHSCSAYQALTLAFALAVSGLAALLLARSRAPAKAGHVTRRDTPLTLPFHSRAPPAFLLA